MAVDTRIQIPFNPSEGITGQILAALQAANEQHFRQQQLALQQQQVTQTGQYQQQEIDVRKRAQDLMEKGFDVEQALKQSQAERQQAETESLQQTIQQRKQILGIMGQPAPGAQPAAAPTNVSAQAPAPNNPSSDWVAQNIPGTLQPLVSGIVGPLGSLSDTEKSTLAAAHSKGLATMFEKNNMAAYAEPFTEAAKDIISKRGAPEPVSEFEKPEKLQAPGAQAAIDARIADPRTKPEEVIQLTKLKSLATQAQNRAIAMKSAELKAEQAAKQGDPNDAGRMLANYELTLQDLKTRGSTPDFILKAAAAAKQQNPDYNIVAADKDAKVAGSEENTKFFGNAHSLTEPGGTLDQLIAQGQKIPANQLPAANKIEDWVKLASGKGPLAGYAATVVGVADDYAKVMGGGQGSDTSRQMIVDLIKPSASPEQRQSTINAIRSSVKSQTDARIGKNPFLRKMYGDEAAPAAATSTAPPTPPQGATMRVPGSDGKLHWSDGKQDLGVAE